MKAKSKKEGSFEWEECPLQRHESLAKRDEGLCYAYAWIDFELHSRLTSLDIRQEIN